MLFHPVTLLCCSKFKKHDERNEIVVREAIFRKLKFLNKFRTSQGRDIIQKRLTKYRVGWIQEMNLNRLFMFEMQIGQQKTALMHCRISLMMIKYFQELGS